MWFKEASACADSATWHLAMEFEMNSINANKTWDLVELPKNWSALSCKWVYRIKEMFDSATPKFKQFHFEYSGAKIKKDNAQTENDKKTETIFHIENPKGKTTGVLELRTRSL